MNYKTFETERLLLQPTSVKDASMIYKLLNTPKWLQYIGDRNIKTVTEAKKYIEKRMLPQLHRLGYGNYTVIRKSDKQKIGSCGLYDREGVEGVDIGFAFLPQYEQKGYAFEAASCILHAAFYEFNIQTVQGYTTKQNYGSQKLLEKLGLLKKGTVTLPDDDEEILLYKIEKVQD